jgi:CHASE1-domain containing sensor protein
VTPSTTRGTPRAWIASALAIVVLLTGMEATLAAGFALQDGPREVASQAIDRRSELVADAVSTETRRYTDSMRSLAAAAGAASPLDPERFAALTDPIREKRLAGAARCGSPGRPPSATSCRRRTRRPDRSSGSGGSGDRPA